MSFFFISYGLPKSASTFAWQLIKQIAVKSGLPVVTLSTRAKGRDAPEDYIDPLSSSNIDLVLEDIGDASVVIKTHSDVTPAVLELVNRGRATVFASYRDPRDIALSLLDHAKKSRQAAVPDFANIFTISDTIPLIDIQIRRFLNWAKLANPLLIDYEEIAFSTEITARRIAERIGAVVDLQPIVDQFLINKQNIGQFNKGRARRFESEMSRCVSSFFLYRFSEFYSAYLPNEITNKPNGYDPSATKSAMPNTASKSTNPEEILAVQLDPSRSLRYRPTRDDVVWCYRQLLGRNPESDEVIDRQIAACGDFRSLVLRFVGSAEFHQKLGIPARPPLSGPAMKVEVSTQPPELDALMERIRKAWTHMGATTPHYSVLTGMELLPENLSKAALDRFWDSGHAEAGTVAAILERHGVGELKSRECVELGCGVGRVSSAFSTIFKKVTAYDISSSHLALAEQHAGELKIKNVRFILFDGAKLPKCDLFYSRLVFQHNPPPVIRQLVMNGLSSLRGGGFAIFQVPTYGADYSFHVREYLADEWSPRMEMHCFPQSEVFGLAGSAGCELLEVREDNSIGKPGWVSNLFVIRRPENKAVERNPGARTFKNTRVGSLAQTHDRA